MIIKGEDLKYVQFMANSIDQLITSDGEKPYISATGATAISIPDELIDKYIEGRDTKYHIHVIPNDLGYFQQNIDDKDYILDALDYDKDYKYEFSTKEIDDLCKEFPQIDFWACVEEV